MEAEAGSIRQRSKGKTCRSRGEEEREKCQGGRNQEKIWSCGL